MISGKIKGPTPDPELNVVLRELVERVQAVLGDNFISAYLQGSFAVGDWDVFSDVDFLIVVVDEISETHLNALQSMHSGIYDLESNWAKHLEGSYFPAKTVRHPDPSRTKLLYLDNTSRALVRSDHDNTRVVRWITRECGITLAGPDPREMIDPISATELRQEVHMTMRTWAREILSNPGKMNNRWYQPHAVLSYCRMLHTLETGRVNSKPAGARWALNALDGRWAELIKRACDERPNPTLKVTKKADPEDFRRTLDFINYALALSQNDANVRF